ncbi:hypothetical protein D1872_252950 [compost metagenome]
MAVLNVAEPDDAFLVRAGQRKHKRVRPRGDDQGVVPCLYAGLRNHLFLHRIDFDYRIPGVKADSVVRIPIQVVDYDFFHIGSTRQYGGQHDPVIIRMRLRSENGNFISVRGQLQDMLDRPHSRHPIADQHQFFLFTHVRFSPSVSFVLGTSAA